MKLSEAIEILTKASKEPDILYSEDFLGALALSIEALKRYEIIRANFGKLKGDKLPGETKD